MRQINWQSNGLVPSVQIGPIHLSCLLFSEGLWFAHVYTVGLPGNRVGPTRRFVTEAKEDAIQIARDLLWDFHLLAGRYETI